MASLEISILDALCAAARGEGPPPADGSVKPAGFRAMRGVFRDLRPEDFAHGAVVFRAAEQETERYPQPAGALNVHQLVVSAVIYAPALRVPDPEDPTREIDQPPEDATDRYVTWVRKAVMADETLGGLTHGIQEAGTSWEDDFEDAPIAAAVLLLRVSYHTLAIDPERRS